MNGYEKLEEEAYQNGIHVIDYDFNSEKIKGLYCDGIIGLNKNLDSLTEKSCVLAEELGHYYTTSGNIIDQSDVMNRKQELKARFVGYNIRIGVLGLIKAFEHGCQSYNEVADYLEVTEEYLKEAIECYTQKYGTHTVVDNYIIYFIPRLGIMKMG